MKLKPHIGSKRTVIRFAFLPVKLSSGRTRFLWLYKLTQRLELDAEKKQVWVALRKDPM